MDGYMGVVTIFAGEFVPKNWASCDGTQLSISQNAALYTILGTTYGGDGQLFFNLPDLRGRATVSFGQGLNVSPYTAGQTRGGESTTLTIPQLASHYHGGDIRVHLQGSENDGNDATSNGGYPSRYTGAYANSPASNTLMQPAAVSATVQATGGGNPFSTLSPFVCVTHIICLQGIFPSRG
jgi:microcystin-dependent protein